MARLERFQVRLCADADSIEKCSYAIQRITPNTCRTPEMKAISKRICKLESQFGLGPGAEQLLSVVTAAGRVLALDQDRCIQILRECGSLPTGPVGVVNLGQIPDGLNAEELERFLRKDGAEIRGLRGAQNHDGPAGGALQENQSRSVQAAIQ